MSHRYFRSIRLQFPAAIADRIGTEIFRLQTWAASKGLPLMWIARDITARTLIWLAAISVPMQALPAPRCACIGAKSFCQEERSQGCCCSAEKVHEGRCCCAGRQGAPAHSCCGKARSGPNLACKCGFNCQCPKTKQSKPATPPVGNNQTEKMARKSLTTVSLATVDLSQTTQRRKEPSAVADALAALDRCVSLCRFML